MFNLLGTTTTKTSVCAKAVEEYLNVNKTISEQVKKISIPQGLVIGKEIEGNPFNPKRKDEKEQWADYMNSRGLDKMPKNERKICKNAYKSRYALDSFMKANETIEHRSLEMTTRNALKAYDLEGQPLVKTEPTVTDLKEDVAKFFKTQCKKHGKNSHELFDAITELFEGKFDQEMYDATTEFSTKNVVNE